MSPFSLTTATAVLACPRCSRAINAGEDYFAVLHTHPEPHLCLWCATADLSRMVGGILPVMPLSFIKKLLRQQRIRELLDRPLAVLNTAITTTQTAIDAVLEDTQQILHDILPDTKQPIKN